MHSIIPHRKWIPTGIVSFRRELIKRPWWAFWRSDKELIVLLQQVCLVHVHPFNGRGELVLTNDGSEIYTSWITAREADTFSVNGMLGKFSLTPVLADTYDQLQQKLIREYASGSSSKRTTRNT